MAAAATADPFADTLTAARPVAETTADTAVGLIASRPARPGQGPTVNGLTRNPAGLAPVAERLAGRLTNDPVLADHLARVWPATTPDAAATALVEAIDDAWTESVASNPLSIALQQAIAERFATTDRPTRTGPWPNTTGMRELALAFDERARTDPDAFLADLRPLLDGYVTEQYQHTQDTLADRGITHLRLFRGMRFDSADPDAADAVATARRRLGAYTEVDTTEPVRCWALSSWSMDSETAEWFAGMGDPWPSDSSDSYGQLVDVVVPAGMVWAVPACGPGDVREAEALLIGAAGMAKTTWKHIDDDLAFDDPDLEGDWWDADGPDGDFSDGAW